MTGKGASQPSDVDWRQWLALLRVSVRTDWRSGRAVQGFGSRGGRAWSFVASVLVLKLLIGATLAALIAVSVDRFFPTALYFTLVMFAVASSVVLDFPAVAISPDDHALLAHLPVSSRTFFLARVSRLLLYVTALVAPLALLPCLSLAAAGGFSVVRGAVAVLATVGAAFATALAIVVLYTAIQQLVPRTRQRVALTTLQFGLGLALYGAVVALPALLGSFMQKGVTVGKPWWLMLNPASWFASWTEIASGRAGWLEVVPALMSAVTLVGGVGVASGRMSLEYADGLSASDPIDQVGPTLARVPLAARRLAARLLPSRFLRHEGRAVALLVRAQFRFDLRFRLAVLGIAPLTIVYLIAGVVMDAEGRGSSSLGRPRLYHFATMLFPVMLQQSLIRSDAYQAAWVYRVTPTSAIRVLLALKDLVFGCFVVPYLVLVGVAAWVFSGRTTSLGLGLVAIALASHAFLLAALWIEPRLPFSIPSRRPAEGRALMGTMLATAAVGQAIAPVLDAMTASLPVAVGVLVGLTVVNVAIRRALLARVDSLERRGLYDA